MALLLNDGFSLYNNVAGGLQVKGWTLGSSVVSGQFATARVSTSKYLQMSGSTANRTAVQLFSAFSGTTSVVGLATRWSGAGTLPGDVVSMSVGGSAVRIVLETISAATHVTLWKDSTQVADLGVIAASTWYYIEFKVLWATAGNVIVRISGSVYHNAAMTLAAPSAGLTVGLRNALAGTAAIDYADLLIMDGSGSTFNDFEGDVTIETLFPTADGATSGWALVGASVNVTFKRLTANVAKLDCVSHSFVVGEEVVVAGVDATFDGTHIITAITASQISYTKVAADVAAVASGGTFTSIDHFGAVNDAPLNNGDTDYVHTSTVNAVDTYTMQDLATSSVSPVLAVRPVLVARKESAAVMSIAPVVRVAGTDYPGTSRDLLNTLAYSAESDTLTASPATAAQWTRAEVDAIEVGPKKTA